MRLSSLSLPNVTNTTPSPMSRKVSSFPLPSGYFPDIHLSAEQIAAYERRMQAIVENALKDYALHDAMGNQPRYSNQWDVVATVGDLIAIEQPSVSAPTYMKSRLFGRVQGEYQQFLNFYYSESSEQLLHWNQFVYGSNVAVDAAVLCNIKTNNTRRASEKQSYYMGVKWVCLQPKKSSVMHRITKRDVCFLEYMIHTKDRHGRDVAVRVQAPVEIAECPPFAKSMKVRRMIDHSVSIIRAVESSVADPKNTAMEIFMMSVHEETDWLASRKYYKKLMYALYSMQVLLDLQRVWSNGMVSRSNWVAKRSRQSCSVCHSHFGTMRFRHHCRLCGDVVCRSCLRVCNAPKHKNHKCFKVVKAKFCLLCVNKLHDPLDEDFVSTAGSDIHEKSPSEGDTTSDCNLNASVFPHSSADEQAKQASAINNMSPTQVKSIDLQTAKTAFVNTTTLMLDDLSSLDGDDHLTIDSPGVIEVDTDDMIPLKRSHYSTTLTLDSDYEFRPPAFLLKQGLPTEGVSPTNSVRSIDQCLYEQEELLRRMVFESSRVRTTTAKHQQEMMPSPSSSSLVATALAHSATTTIDENLEEKIEPTGVVLYQPELRSESSLP